MNRTAKFSIATWAATVLSCLVWAPALTPIVLICFVQNVSFTIVSRARNSASLSYHVIAAFFSNGIYAVMLFWSVDLISKGAGVGFIVVYALSCMSGSVFAHWLALRTERGAGARRGREDPVKIVRDQLDKNVKSLRREMRELYDPLENRVERIFDDLNLLDRQVNEE